MLKVLVIFIIFAVSIQTSAADKFEPAKFRDGNKSLAAKIRFSNHIPEGETVIKCAGWLSRYGWLMRVGCESSIPRFEKEKQVKKGILVATHRVKMTPARVNGKKKTLWINFSVIFNRNNEQKSIEVVENHLIHRAELGLYYTSPQAIYDPKVDHNWYSSNCAHRMIFEVNVSELGVPSGGKTLFTSKPEAPLCRDKALTLMLTRKYIPATVDGKNISARYQELFYVADRDRNL